MTFYNPDSPSSSTQIFIPGGFIYVSVGVELAITSSQFSKGNAYAGGAIYMSGNSVITITTCTFTDNYSETHGGSIYLSTYDSVEVNNTNFNSGIARTDGSEIYSNSGTLTVDT